ncbi:MAG: 30S ribosomal protein S18 [Myxococcales bacterium]|nr:30S ribosomal protein S18 [Myxococcales bacterium]
MGGKGGRGNKTRKLAKIEEPIDYKNPALLKRYITDRGRIVPRRLSGLSAKQQRSLAVAIRRARMLALLPFSVSGE